MNQPWYFLSYAKLDADKDPYNCIRRFYEDLDKEVAKLKNIKKGEAGFFDRKGLQQGSNWPTALVDALSTCRTLICMYSPPYFASEYCGKEWQIFNSRFSQTSKDSVAEAQKPKLILPVLFRPPDDWDDLPPVLEDIQYDDDDYPTDYLENGLLYLMRRDSKKEVYLNFLDVLVHKLIEATDSDKQPLPDLDSRPDIKSVKSAFHPQTEPTLVVNESKPQPAPLPAKVGPKNAEFVYVAARREEVSSIKPISPKIEYYGDESLHWKPYWPDVETHLGLFAEYVASREGFTYNKISLETDLVSQIKEAQANKRIVVVVVDTWTLFLERYWQIMRHYDDASFWNSVLLVVWNDKDPAVVNNREALEEVLQKTFTTKMIIRDDRYFVDNIRNASDLEARLSIALQTMLAQIINAETRFKKIASAQTISKPEIPAPGGASI